VPVVDEAEALKVLETNPFSGPVPRWARLLANFPESGKSAITSQLVLMEKGNLSPQLKAEINWVAARHDRAWYALGQAAKQLEVLGYSEDQMFALDQPEQLDSEAQRAVLALAAKLTDTPQGIADADIAEVRKHFSDSEVAEIVYRITQAAFFDRLTEAAALPLEG
jgi:alkylhydroperoxidase family enzyme